MTLEDIENAVKKSTYFAAIVIIAIPSSYFIWFYISNDYQLALDSGVWGSFGDFFGGILNPLIALLAFYWLTQSVLIQKRELKDTKDALVDSSESQKQQVITQEKKRFEDTFFSLLEQHNKVLEKLESFTIVNNRENPSAIDRIKNSLRTDNSLNSVFEARVKLHNIHNPICGHYFRILYQLLKLIFTGCPGRKVSDSFTVEEIKSLEVSKDEKLYSNILRSFLSYDMTKILAINCLSKDDNDSYYKYRLLIERYEFLEHMPLDDAFSIECIDKYDEKAFGKSEFLDIYKNS